MPTKKTTNLPPPSSWDEFEAMMADLTQKQWKAPFTNRYGRQGQSQDGVDIFCKPHGLEQSKCGIQCKNTKNLTISEIQDEIRKAQDFVPPLDLYIIATTAPNDAELQEQVRELSENREAEGKFPVKIQMWDDIRRDLSNHDELLEVYYPQIFDKPALHSQPPTQSEEPLELQDLTVSKRAFEPGEIMILEAKVDEGSHVERVYCRFEHEKGGGAVYDIYRDFNPPVGPGTYEIEYEWPKNAPGGGYRTTWVFARDDVGNRKNFTDLFANQLEIEIQSKLTDIDGPVIHNFGVSGGQFEPGDTMKIDANVSDESGIERLYFRFEHENRGGAVFDASRDFDPPVESGVYTIEYEWPENAPAGRYDATWIFAKDSIGNQSNWTNAFSEEEKRIKFTS